jgi:uncharacterized protein with von Willebrand factor type A (vWA) domain
VTAERNGSAEVIALPVERLAVGFARVLRQAGLKVPASATINFTQALGAVGITERSGPYWAGRATLVNKPEDIDIYDQAFLAYWDQRPGVGFLIETPPDEQATLAIDADGDDDDTTEDEDEADQPDDLISLRFSRLEVLGEKDFTECTPDELAELSLLLGQLRFTTHQRKSLRHKRVRGSGDRADLRRTVQLALKHQGEPIHRSFTSPATKPRALTLILDVSGSMETYARALIRFCHAAVVARNRVEVFALGTRLTRITRQLSNHDPDAAIAAATPEVADWSGGTRLGDAIAEFNNEWGVKGMARGGVVVILSDGWDRGEPEVLAEQMERLHRVTHELIWVNPLKASPGYAPLAAGMAAAYPHLDTFVSGHSFNSLVDLALLLANSSQPTRT